jgi:hypothetical protein
MINLFDSNPLNGHSFMNNLKKEFDKKMTPKEKAEELVDKFIQYTPADSEFEYPYAKKCALIAVDYMLSNAAMIWGGRNTETGLTARDEFRKHWYEVKNEIEKL